MAKRRISAILALTTSFSLVVIMFWVFARSPFANITYARSITYASANVVVSPTFQVEPIRQGSFSAPSQISSYTITITNDSSIPTDTYEIVIDSTWDVSLHGPDGTSILEDTNGNGLPDTGPVDVGSSTNIQLKVSAPPNAVVGDQISTSVQIISWLNSIDQTVALLDTAIPTSFTQILRDNGRDSVNHYLIQPEAQTIFQTSPSGSKKINPAIAETPEGYAMVWCNRYFNGNQWVTELEYRLTDKQGNTLTPVKKLTKHETSTIQIHDLKPVVSASSDGNWVVAWLREKRDAIGDLNQNIHYVTIDAEGNLVHPVVNFTNNTTWGSDQSLNLPTYDSPRVETTRDDRFVIAWVAKIKQSETAIIQDIHFAIRDRNGGIITNTINLTNDLPNEDINWSPTIAAVGPDRFLLAWVFRQVENDDVYFIIADSQGNVIEPAKNLSTNEIVVDWYLFDAIELTGGKIVVAWKAWGCTPIDNYGRIRYAIIVNNGSYNNPNYKRFGNPDCLPNISLATGGDWGVALTADGLNNWAITWTDEWNYQQDPEARRRLYYALVDDRGNVITEPMVYYRSSGVESPISVSYEGYAISSRIFVDSFITTGSVENDPQDPNLTTVSIRYGNSGTVTATGVVLTATLDPQLTYNGDSALDPNPVITGTEVTWGNLPELQPGEIQEFVLGVNRPITGEIGTTYPLTLTLSTNAVEWQSDNNQVRIVIGGAQRFVYLPSIWKP